MYVVWSNLFWVNILYGMSEGLSSFLIFLHIQLLQHHMLADCTHSLTVSTSLIFEPRTLFHWSISIDLYWSPGRSHSVLITVVASEWVLKSKVSGLGHGCFFSKYCVRFSSCFAYPYECCKLLVNVYRETLLKPRVTCYTTVGKQTITLVYPTQFILPFSNLDSGEVLCLF